MSEVLQLNFPIEKGMVVDWDDLEVLLHHVFSHELGAPPADHPILCSQAPLTDRKNWERLIEMLFETFNAPAIHVSIQPVLSLYSTGRTTGMVVDCGDTVSHVVPVSEGYAASHSIQRLDFGGRDLTDHLRHLMAERGDSLLASLPGFETARDMKEKLSSVAFSHEAAMAPASSTSSYSLPDGNVITLGSEIYGCPEALFHPSLLGRQSPGLPEMVHHSISKSDAQLEGVLYGNILLTGGSSMFPGLNKRLEGGIRALARTPVKVGVVSRLDPHCSAWLGGSILASLGPYQPMWVSAQVFAKHGGVGPVDVRFSLAETNWEREEKEAETVEGKLYRATRDGDEAAVRRLLKTFPTLDVNWMNFAWLSALHRACASGRHRIASILLAHPDIQVNLKNRSPWTPFMYACDSGNLLCVRLLLKDARVKVDEPRSDGHTPLEQGIISGHLGLIKSWIASGREMNLGKPGSGDDVVMEARRCGLTTMVTLLEKFRGNQVETRRAVRQELGWYDEAAAGLFALVVFVSDGLLDVRRDSSADPLITRFFIIAAQLPLELQMVLCHRVIGSPKDTIRGDQTEQAFQDLAALLL